MSNMFEWNKANKTKCEEIKESIEPVEQEEIKCESVEKVEEVVEKEKESVVSVVEEEYFTLDQVANKLGISITLLRNKLPEYNIKPKKAGKILSVSMEEFQNIRKQRVVNGIRKLSCIEDFELCDECMRKILK